MDFFEKLRSSMARFMAGRNGLDALNRALLWGYAGLWILRIVPVLFRAWLLVRLVDVLMNVGAVLLIFRVLSRNLTRRQAENGKWLEWQGSFLSRCRRLGIEDSVRNAGNSVRGTVRKAQNSIRSAAARRADREHRYFTCKNCKAVCRVPAGKGKIVLTCPKCGAQRKVKT